MKEQIQLLIAQHKLHLEECKVELEGEHQVLFEYSKYDVIKQEIEMITLFISELQELLSF